MVLVGPSSTGKGSHDSQSPKGSLRIVFACHPAKAVGLWVLSIVPHDTDGKSNANFHLKVGKGTGFVGEPRDLRIQ